MKEQILEFLLSIKTLDKYLYNTLKQRVEEYTGEFNTLYFNNIRMIVKIEINCNPFLHVDNTFRIYDPEIANTIK